MKRTSVTVFLLLLSSLTLWSHPENPTPRKFRKIQKFMDRATAKALAGVIIYIRTPKLGEWVGASGYASLKEREPIRTDHILSLASIGKMYNAVAVWKLVEQGKLQLDEKITRYLPKEITDHLPNANQVTIRHLLGHTSGFQNYESDPELNGLYLSGKLKLDTLSHEKVLKRYVFGKLSTNSPGNEFHYSSTNYMLLAMIMDTLLPGGHTEFMRKLVQESGSSNTYYRQTPPNNNVSYYGDLDQDSRLEPLTSKTFETTNWFKGDDGIYASAQDAGHFVQALMAGKLLNASSLSLMKNGNTVKTDTGLGLTTDESFPYYLLYGHSGRGIGSTADLYYFPKQDITVAILCNTGLRGGTPSIKKSYLKMRARIVRKLFLF